MLIGCGINGNGNYYTFPTTFRSDEGSETFWKTWADWSFTYSYVAASPNVRFLLKMMNITVDRCADCDFYNRDGQKVDLSLLDTDREKFLEACRIGNDLFVVYYARVDYMDNNHDDWTRFINQFRYEVSEDGKVCVSKVVPLEDSEKLCMEEDEESLVEEGESVVQQDLLEFDVSWDEASPSVDQKTGRHIESHEAVRDPIVINRLLKSVHLSHLEKKDIRNGSFWSVGNCLVAKYTGSMNQWAEFFYSRREDGDVDIQKRVTPLIELFKCSFVILSDPHKILFRELEENKLKGAAFRKWIEEKFECEEEFPSSPPPPLPLKVSEIVDSSLFDDKDEEDMLWFPNLENGTKRSRQEEEEDAEDENIPRPGTPILFPIVIEGAPFLLPGEEEESPSPSKKQCVVE